MADSLDEITDPVQCATAKKVGEIIVEFVRAWEPGTGGRVYTYGFKAIARIDTALTESVKE